MTPILSADAARAADDAASARWGVPSRVLMETAGRAVADAAERLAGDSGGRRATVLAGAGNNGGDGFVAARVLHARGWTVHVAHAPGDFPPDASANADLARALADEPQVGVSHRLTVAPFAGDAPPADVVIDALLGIGAGGPMRDDAVGAMAAWANRQSAPVLAVDLPSGLDATTGAAPDGAVRATATLALGALKTGLLVGRGPALAGRLRVAEIGIPETEIASRAVAWRPTRGWVRDALPIRAPDAHKYAAGRALVVAGSRAYSGAAVLASTAALRTGAGAVVCATTPSAAAIVDAHAAEVMADAMTETDGGTLAVTSYDRLVERAAWADAVLIGPGLGRVTETGRLVQALLRRLAADARPAVLDADALRAVRAEKLAERAGGDLVLTPHLGELRALLADEAFDPADRVEAVRELAVTWRATVVFKGMPSLVGTPDGRVIVGPSPEPSLATAGAGDVLAGTIAGLLAQGLAPDDAAVAALVVGTAAARIAGADGLVASDLVRAMPRALARLRR